MLAQAGADVTLTWQSEATTRRRTSRLSSDDAARCRQALKADEVRDHIDHIRGRVVGGSKLRGVVEIEAESGEVYVVRSPEEDVTSCLSSYAGRQVVADVLVLTARSPLGREHHSYTLVEELRLDED